MILWSAPHPKTSSYVPTVCACIVHRTSLIRVYVLLINFEKLASMHHLPTYPPTQITTPLSYIPTYTHHHHFSPHIHLHQGRSQNFRNGGARARANQKSRPLFKSCVHGFIYWECAQKITWVKVNVVAIYIPCQSTKKCASNSALLLCTHETAVLFLARPHFACALRFTINAV